MPWGRIDDKLHRNPKQLSMSDAAFRLWVLSWSYCLDTPNPTGFMTHDEALAFARTHRKGPKVIDEVVAKRGWELADGGYLVHDLPEYLKESSRERTRAWRERKRLGDAPSDAPVTNGDVTVTPSRARARDGKPGPGPGPGPVPGNASKKASSGVRERLKDAISNGRTDDLATQLAKRVMDDVVHRTLTPLEVAWCDQVLQEFAYFGVDDVVERMQSQLEWGKQQKLDPPTSTMWFTQALRIENDHRADAGKAKAYRPAPVAGDLSKLAETAEGSDPDE